MTVLFKGVWDWVKQLWQDHSTGVVATGILFPLVVAAIIGIWAWTTKKPKNSAKDHHKEPTGRNDLHYSKLRIQTIGREAEMDKLRSFLNRPDEFLWWMITGEGGTGKSKLCYDFMKKMKRRGWQPCMPSKTDRGFTREELLECSKDLPKKTLFILDYAEYNTREIAQWMAGLGRGEHLKKIRVLLIQRRVDTSSAHVDMINENCRGFQHEKEPLQLDLPISPDAMQTLIRKYVKKKKGSIPAERVYELLKSDGMDPKLRRPLYALMIAEALMAGKSITSQADLLDYIYIHEKDTIKKAVLDTNGLNNEDITTALMIKAVATMSGAIPVCTAGSLLGRQIPVAENYGAPDFTKLRVFDDDICEPLEPDIIGAYFVLRCLGEDWMQVKQQGQATKRDKCIQTAWQRDENHYMRGFMQRLMQECGTSSGAFSNEKLAWFSAVEIREGESEIASQSFRKHTYIQTLRLPASVRSIGFEAFVGCENLERVTFDDGSGLQSIGPAAFYGCKKLTNVNLPERLEAIGAHAFDSCPLAGVAVPAGVIKSGKGAFYGCGVTFPGGFNKAARLKLLGGKTIEFGGLIWEVLDRRTCQGKDQALIITREIVEHRAYDAVTEKEWDDDSYEGVTWEECSLRAYLNNKVTVREYTLKDSSRGRLDFRDSSREPGFLSRFSKKDRERIWDLDAHENRRVEYKTTDGTTTHEIKQPPTCDSVFLLSAEEAEQYFRAERMSAKQYLDYYRALGFNPGVPDEELLNSDWFPAEFPQSDDLIACDGEQTYWWWLRSPGAFPYNAAYVNNVGNVYLIGNNTFRAAGGVRPALWLNL